jgi:alkylhydroperoxidase/carboxymuconolactone decarboxylase family protein YurZ
MARPAYQKVAKAMKGAKTGHEMTASWSTQRPGTKPTGGGGLAFWSERKPEMIYTFAHNQLTQLVDRGILDPKTSYLCILAAYMGGNHWEGLLPQCCNAKAAGATDEEIMEVAHIACYAVSKAKLVDTSHAVAAVFESPSYKNVQRLE